MSEPDRRLRYGGRWFSAASALPLDGLSRPRRLLSLFASGALRPWRVAALIIVLLRTKTEYVLLTESSAGRALRSHFTERSFGLFPRNRFCRGVLPIPQRHSDYLRGRQRQALRTNLRAATAAGVRCEELSDRSLLPGEISQVLRGKGRSVTDPELRVLASTWRALFTEGPEMTVMVARDERGTALAIMGAVIDDMVCLIRVAVASSHHARWALHNHLVRILIDRGVRYLLADGGGPFGALGFGTNVHHYQHLLGYELRHIAARPFGMATDPKDGSGTTTAARSDSWSLRDALTGGRRRYTVISHRANCGDPSRPSCSRPPHAASNGTSRAVGEEM
jgi:hypothetical protein